MSEDIKSDMSEADSAKSNAADKVAELEQLAEKHKNDFLYLRAEFDNYKKHAIKERSELLKYGAERLIIDLLEVVDNFERALETKASAENFQNYVKGVEMTSQELRQTLNKFGVAVVESQGKAFDPNIHEALGSEPSDSTPAGHITRVLKKPYKMYDKVIRPGQVIVAKEKSND